MLLFYKELPRDVRCHLIMYSRYIPGLNDLVVAVAAGKQGVTAGEDTVSIEFCGQPRGDIRNTRRIAETNREGAGIHFEMEGDGERQEMRSSSCL